MIVVCTGMSGSGRKSAICAMLECYKPKKVKLINTGERMYEKSREVGYPISEGKILDCSEKDLDYLRAIVYEDILREKDDSETMIINTHACFRWNKYITKAFDYYYLTKLNPDLYITITDTIYSIYGRLEGTKWKGRNALWELLAWRDEEEHITKTFAMIQKKKHYTISRDEPPETMYNIIFNSDVKKTYLSYPISAGDEEAIKKVREFRDTLRKSIVVFDPLAIKDIEWLTAALAEKKKGKTTIEIPFKDDHGKDEKTIFDIKNLEEVEDYLKDQTISRDYNLISQSDFVTVFYHDPEINSPGVQREIRYAKENGKDVYIYYPKKEMSPFQEKDVTKHFIDPEELITFLIK
jgi:adenylate kinase